MAGFRVAMDPSMASTIEVSAPTVESEEPLMAERIKKLKVAELKVQLQRRALAKNGNKSVLCNRLLGSV